MNNNYKYYNKVNGYNNYPNMNYTNTNDERLAGGFVFPFLLGGVTGAALAPNFYNNQNYYRPMPYYDPYFCPYCRPRRWF